MNSGRVKIETHGAFALEGEALPPAGGRTLPVVVGKPWGEREADRCDGARR